MSSQWLISFRFSSYNSLRGSELIYLKLYGWFPEVTSIVTFTWKYPFESWPGHVLSWLRLVLCYFSPSVELRYITICLSMTASCHCSPAFFDLMSLNIVTRLPWANMCFKFHQNGIPDMSGSSDFLCFCLLYQGKHCNKGQCPYKRSTEARSNNLCCQGGGVLHILRVCVCSLSYPAYNAHTHLWPVRLYHIFSHYLIPRKMLLKMKSVLIFSATYVWNIFYSRRIQRDTVINVHRYSCKVSTILVRF